MAQKIILGIIWLVFVIYAFFFAPPNQPDTLDLIINLSTGKWDGINPIITSLFNIMGIWPIIYSGVIITDGRMQKIPAWPFALFSFAVGAFAILPYLILRQPNSNFDGQKTLLLKIVDSRWIGLSATLGTIAFLFYAFSMGDSSNFIQQWQTSRFIHVMSLDFCLLCLLFPILLKDDMIRRGLKNNVLFWLVSLVPLLGSAIYLMIRPPLRETTID
ncbi:DUF2834 domain-containing protein [Aphanothece hegewaldii CCALA 016]|uniref:DUF2834 domain-containing protein n=1 Tax=Aphanothece hegewaldii CCALA 016 TaxID=2107694 RepID=A0A2T1LUC9_9CHRO|nr:DUF2834 domain-containing protein [Aphanothece hegewaldii]PSF35146.1 DUF2834 domain-containing protein [Aphanothece hegewaldii CCALA 016]